MILNDPRDQNPVPVARAVRDKRGVDTFLDQRLRNAAIKRVDVFDNSRLNRPFTPQPLLELR
jgi:hypothetical protein